MEYTKDMFDEIVQDYDQLKQRAKQVFAIRWCHFLDSDEEQIDYIDFDQHTVEIETSTYCCGDRDVENYSFPSHLLLKPDEEIHAYFAELKRLSDEVILKQKQRREQEERERTEKYEREQLGKLLAKYGEPK